jgi:hypothetical protein
MRNQPQNSPSERRVVTLNEAAAILRISRGSAYEAAKRKEIPTIRRNRAGRAAERRTGGIRTHGPLLRASHAVTPQDCRRAFAQALRSAQATAAQYGERQQRRKCSKGQKIKRSPNRAIMRALRAEADPGVVSCGGCEHLQRRYDRRMMKFRNKRQLCQQDAVRIFGTAFWKPAFCSGFASVRQYGHALRGTFKFPLRGRTYRSFPIVASVRYGRPGGQQDRLATLEGPLDRVTIPPFNPSTRTLPFGSP